MENTNPTGSESLDVNQAASAFEGMMGDSDGASDSQPEEQTEYQQETDEVEYSEESEMEGGEEESAEGEPVEGVVKVEKVEVPASKEDLIKKKLMELGKMLASIK